MGAIKDDLPFEVETDASDYAIAATLSQNGRPVAYFSGTLNKTEKCYPAIEKEATAVIEAVRKWSHFLLGKHFPLYTDLRSVPFNKILSWKIELNQFSNDIKHKPGQVNVAPDALSRIVNLAIAVWKRSLDLHNQLGHPGFARFYHFVKSRNLFFTSEETKEACQACKTCAEVKPRYFKPPRGQLIKAMKPLERISMDFKGPLKGRYPYLLILIDEYSRYPFAFPYSSLSTKTAIDCLSKLFCLFGFPSYVHSDRGTSFMSKEWKAFSVSRGIASSHSTPYHPHGNGQCERSIQTVWRTIKLQMLHERSLPEERRIDVLAESLHSIRSLLCLATNDTHTTVCSQPYVQH